MSNSYKRIDAHLSSLGYCSRSEAAAFLKKYHVTAAGKKLTDVKLKVTHDEVLIDGKGLDPEVMTILMHKPASFICSHDDAGKLIYSLLPERWQRRNPKLSTIGRLDIDTTGAILLTDDGGLNHKLTSPKSQAPKIYEATLAEPLKGNEAEIFASGELMLNGEKKALLPAKLEVLSPTKARLEICEGKYHQVKRMFGATGNKVIALHRVSFNGFCVDDLKAGEYKQI
ncbi:MAG: pseudouridine synthase [Sulfurimonas sp.]|nr:pseudouridine synthase [Sulfurimonas sp.]